MALTIESESITPLLVTIDKGEFAPSEYLNFSNQVADRTVTITKDTEQARKLLKSEKKKIAERGNDISAYLSRDNVTIKDILETYYRGVVDTKDGRKLSGSFTVSEMMLMLGAFSHLMLVRQIYLDGYTWSLRKIKAQKMIKKVTSKFRKGESAEEFSFVEEMTANSKICEQRMLFYMKNQVTVLMNAILEEMGTTFKEAPRKQLESICLDSHELCTLGVNLNSYFEKRKEEGPAVFNDVALLDACGEHHADLYQILSTETFQANKEKRV